jgi:O-antigen/teichoic acid export membrane protein
MQVIAFASLVGLILCIYNYLVPHGPISGSAGALLVLISTALMLFASLWIAYRRSSHNVMLLLEVLIVLDIFCTAVCAYFLESNVLLFLMVVALGGWCLHMMRDRARVSAA